ncbi:N-glycosylase/DNA lyase [Liparis tanakae]|uniref:N-glycosylase/DNA lyase n=1 Tax=Liparis tanakae TaxID=230148 RepID=A0A4Z2EE38_9TELE|nr:N-glycosylase/DNA lyase [Liparis tanakae]
MAKHALLSSGARAWRSLACARSELRLDLTLGGGQSFRWRETAQGHWTGVMGGRVWTLTQTDDTLWYHVYRSSAGGRKRRKRRAGAALQVEYDKLGKEEGPVAGTPVQEEEEEEQEQEEEEEKMLRDYFQLKVQLGPLYLAWGSADPHFQSIAHTFTGQAVCYLSKLLPQYTYIYV